MYRICVAEDPGLGWALPFPPFEFMRSYLIRQPMNMDVVKSAAGIMNGVHDFRAFTNLASINRQPWTSTVKNVEARVEPGQGFLTDYCHLNSSFSHWNFAFRSHSFLYKQVRKMSAVLVAAGQGVMSLDDIRQLVEYPEDVGQVNRTRITDVPTYALYLTNVQYRQKDLEFPRLS